MPGTSDSSVAEFRARLERLGAQPVLIGALAAERYRAEPRHTVDIDFLVTTLDGVASSLEADGLSVRTVADEDGEPYLAYVRGEGVKVDVLLAETDYQRQAIARAVDGVLTVEDVIVHKLLAWRPRDQDDIASILSVGHDVDDAYIERWAAEWQVGDRWDEARRRWARR